MEKFSPARAGTRRGWALAARLGHRRKNKAPRHARRLELPAPTDHLKDGFAGALLPRRLSLMCRVAIPFPDKEMCDGDNDR